MDNRYDIIIVGSGMAGLSSALSCRYHNNLNKILVLEKSNVYGGTTAKSGGMMWFPKPNNNQTNSIQSYIKYLTQNYQTINDKRDIEWIDFFVKESYNILQKFFVKNRIFPNVIPLSTFYEKNPLLSDYINDNIHDDNLITGYGHSCGISKNEKTTSSYVLQYLSKLCLKYKDSISKYAAKDWTICRMLLFYLSLPYKNVFITTGTGADVCKYMHNACKSNNIKMKTNHSVTGLIWDEVNGNNKCIGVIINNGENKIYSKYGVIFANGGYASNVELCDKYLSIKTYTTCAVKESTGDFINIIQDFNARSTENDVNKIKLRNLDKAWYGQNVLNDYIAKGRNLNGMYTQFTLYGESMFVINKYGKRFMNEKCSYHNKLTKYYIPNNNVDNDYRLTFLIYDEKTRKKYSIHPSSYYIRGKDIDELANNIRKYLTKMHRILIILHWMLILKII